MGRSKEEWREHFANQNRAEEFSDPASLEIMRRRLRYCVKLSGLSKLDKILSVGCGGSEEFSELRKFGIENVVGCDFSKSLVAAARKSGAKLLINCDVESLPVGKEKFDAIISINLIEYLDKPERFFSSATEALKKSGKIILICPNSEAGFFHRGGGLSGKLYSKKEIEKFLSTAGFSIEKVRSFNFLIRKLPKPVFFINKILNFILEITPLSAYGKDIILVARKL